jgi:hypothetical protein
MLAYFPANLAQRFSRKAEAASRKSLSGATLFIIPNSAACLASTESPIHQELSCAPTANQSQRRGFMKFLARNPHLTAEDQKRIGGGVSQRCRTAHLVFTWEKRRG